jgi:thioredoxin reductase
MERIDLVILGSGSTAFAAALRAQELGKTAVLTEERIVGGTCVNRGCLPSKNLIEAARLLHDTQSPRYPGLSPTQPELDFARLVAQKDELIHDYRRNRYESSSVTRFESREDTSVSSIHTRSRSAVRGSKERRSWSPPARGRSCLRSRGWPKCLT